ncbi:uncharacterized protein XM38_011670 [Halomicronema hongdechloris C2206]|uniref:Uncharacterized protein n=1 Tax=Halomicronema hongdechloris C2206 TaxID=1641165 RepID=A0A1Z3HIV5_9CYAN|nr:hypothetical protein [Halomicronema hongdechloris]ASC70231.1 uncharacterized protein XM38_011670 [Halomicronema hongdechloris C2206]
MGIKLMPIVSAMTVLATSGAIASEAMAQASDVNSLETRSIPEAMNDLFYHHSGTYFENRTAWRQLSYMVGPGGWDSARFPEREIAWDADAIHRAHTALMAIQNTSDPTIRVPDLPSPFTTSVQLMPSNQAGTRVMGTEFVFETLPMR